MGIGTSIFLIAVGAILAFAVNIHTNGVDLQTVGVILMLVGVIGVILSAIFWNSWGGFGGYRRTAVYDDGPVVRRRRVVQDDVL
ncbi:MAG: hypothetical protein JOZ68_02070 [Acidimicrobiia bacterium]|nr:hypothetical protein [Acidimicrobiia bacterium]MBV9039760.1 hypothetical protein [Acidimicrobiia bacterium]MBV9283418.1 hypothetical protein [Acidimicrobiia bacterium]